jgi:hypothetical protein
VRIDRALGDVVVAELRMEAARHQVNVERSDFLRQLRRGVEAEAASRRPSRSDVPAGLAQARECAFDLRLHGPPGEFLGGIAKRAPCLEVRFAQHQLPDLAAVARQLAREFLVGRRDA